MFCRVSAFKEVLLKHLTEKGWIKCSTVAVSTCAVAQYVSDAQHLCAEDADGDEELRYDANGSPQVFGREFTQIHGHHVGWQTCRWETMDERNTKKRLRLRNPRRRHACSWNDSIWPAQIPTINLATMMISYDLAISLTPIITAGTMEKMLLKRRVPFLLQGQCMWSRIRPTRKTCFYSRWGQTVCITSLVCWPEEPPSESQRSLPAGTWTRTETTAESKSSPPLADHCAPCRFHYRTAAWTKETRTTAIKKTTSSHHWHCVLQ